MPVESFLAKKNLNLIEAWMPGFNASVSIRVRLFQES